ncbi:MAG: DUF4114 domain-containing protein [Pseudomonadota bacterium]
MSVDTDMNISPVLGTGLADNLRGTGRSEVLSGAGGDDIIQALSGDDEVFGGSGNDLLYGQGGNDTIYGNGKPAYVDMDKMTMSHDCTATVTFMDEGAGYRNSLGVYEIAEDGSIQNIQILFANASKVGSGGSLIPGQSAVQFQVSAGAQLGFFIVSNGFGKGYTNQQALSAESGRYEFRTPEGQIGTINDQALELWHIGDNGAETHIRSQFGNDTFHSIGDASNDYGPNPDDYKHVVARANSVTGELLIGFEDIRGGGDNDYDDTVITVNVGQANVVGLLPESTGNGGDTPDDDIIYGGDGNDKLYGISGDDYLAGGNGNDELSGNSGNDILYGNNGSDVLNGNSGNDELYGGSGSDTLSGNSGDDVLEGNSGDDTLSGGSGNDTLSGGSGKDTLNGGSGNDELLGGSGNDTLNGNSGDDQISGESGADTLNGHSGADVISGGTGSDKLIGGGGNDTLDGGDHNDKLYGGSGNDTLDGGSGNDYLTASSGDDILIGGTGNDKLIGGTGSDTFYFDLSEESIGRDRIYDFSDDDLIMLVGTDIQSFDELQDHMRESGNDLLLEFSNTELITIHKTSLDDINSDLFLLA